MDTITSFIESQENRYKTIPVPIVDNYEWNMSKHIKVTTLYLNSKYETGNDENKPFRNIILPAINLQHRAVAVKVKEIQFFIDNADAYYKSFLLRKYHEKWARVNGLQTFLDELTETFTDYGGVLTKKVKGSIPVVIPWQQIAFSDQTDILSGVIAEKHEYTPDALRDMEAKGWGNEAFGATGTVQEVIAASQTKKTTTQVNGRDIESTSLYSEVYELHGFMPESWLIEGGDDTKYVRQMQIVALYAPKDDPKDRKSITLFRGKEGSNPYKFKKRDEIYGRALGRGGVEELFEAQVWTNYDAIQEKELLDVASKILFITDDPEFETRNETSNLENGQILVTAQGKTVSQLNTTPVNIEAFTNNLNAWGQLAKDTSASMDSINGTAQDDVPFRSTQLLNSEAHSLHEYRKGKLCDELLAEIYRDWIIPQIQQDLTTDKEFIGELSLSEMQEVGEQVVNAMVNDTLKKRILAGFIIGDGVQAQLVDLYKTAFNKKGNKQFFKIFKNELRGLAIDVDMEITGNSKDMALQAEKLSNVFTQVAQFLQADPNFFANHPEMLQLFNQILESSGLSPLQYSTTKVLPKPTPSTPVQPQTQTIPPTQPSPLVPTPQQTTPV